MSYNKVRNRIFVSHITINEVIYTLTAATETSDSNRPSEIAQAVGIHAYSLLLKWDGKLPQATKEICLRHVPDLPIHTDPTQPALIPCLRLTGRLRTFQTPTMKTI